MRIVLYDDESLEPITILNLPLTERDMLDRRIWRVPVPERIDFYKPIPDVPTMSKMRVVDVEFEQFVRVSPRHGKQRSVFAFTRAADLAMLLKPSWLPGQQSAIRALEDQVDALTDMFMRAL